MATKYTIRYERDVTVITLLVSPTLEELMAILDELASQHPYKKRLWDLRKIVLQLTHPELIAISQHGRKKFGEQNKVVFVVRDDVTFGKTRQFLVYRAEDKRVVPQIFRDYEEAFDWVSQNKKAGIMSKVDHDSLEVKNNAARKRFEVEIGGSVAFAEYMLAGKQFVLTHTEVPQALEGQGVGSLLAKTALGYARENELKVLPICPFMSAYIRRHPEYQPLVFGYKPPQ